MSALPRIPRTEVDPLDSLTDEVRALVQALEAANAKPQVEYPYWLRRAVALIGIVATAAFGWVWNTDRQVREMENAVRVLTEGAVSSRQTHENQIRIIQQLEEIQRRLDRLEGP